MSQPIKMLCRKAMWSGYGTPAGTCDEPAYGPQKEMRDFQGGWMAHEIARCPKHGGPTMEEFQEWLLSQLGHEQQSDILSGEGK